MFREPWKSKDRSRSTPEEDKYAVEVGIINNAIRCWWSRFSAPFAESIRVFLYPNRKNIEALPWFQIRGDRDSRFVASSSVTRVATGRKGNRPVENRRCLPSRDRIRHIVRGIAVKSLRAGPWKPPERRRARGNRRTGSVGRLDKDKKGSSWLEVDVKWAVHEFQRWWRNIKQGEPVLHSMGARLSSINKLDTVAIIFLCRVAVSGRYLARRYLRFVGRFIIELIFRASDWINLRVPGASSSSFGYSSCCFSRFGHHPLSSKALKMPFEAITFGGTLCNTFIDSELLLNGVFEK